MAKKPPSGKCVHCLKRSDSLTWDHVFPSAWYPDTTPLNLEKWKIPACHRCNRDYGRLEEDLLWRLGLCVDPKEQKSLGITDRVLRGAKPIFARNERDRQLREARLKRITQQLVRYDSPPQNGVLPNFGPLPNVEYEGYAIITVPKDALVKLGQKIVKGITYLTENTFVGDEYRVDVFFPEDSNVKDVIETIEAHATVYDRGPGIVVKRVKERDEEPTSLWLIEIWGRLKLYATVMPIRDPDKLSI